MKRFQECNKLIQLFRYRWYLLIPFKWFWFTYIRKFRVYEDKIVDGKLINTDGYCVLRGNQLWKILKSLSQNKMHWYYTMNEVRKEIFEK